ncbi:hypothetical protein FLJC2902T_25830 [Flavobacterium limnosediminis JC2902]|uniref:Uncharacterized protein n=1 Tax=Flavobacterium limnosediminis JC2902 TaxID=1341181 RepID=V6SJH1_9FLAO|nr:hypothetical protein FLJC2902T_25830 [Flavobacterium limnosediminis JC2902]
MIGSIKSFFIYRFMVFPKKYLPRIFRFLNRFNRKICG